MDHESQLRAHGLFDARVPRYTSYPAAPQFTAGVGPQVMAEWLGAVTAGTDISLYVHVPFCRRLCWFCACRTQGTQSLDPVLAYVETLLAEVRTLRTRLAPGVRLARLHWGGGTPTLLPPASILRLAEAIRAAFPFAPGAEFSVEIDPSEIDEARIDALAAAGMTRASIGVQDFDPMIQQVIGRDQSFEVTARAVDMIRARGIASLNADILFGLPHQDRHRISETVQKLLALSPDRVALYGYAHVPWMSKRQVMIPDDSLPDSAARLALFRTARDLFAADGYLDIGIDHFARPEDGLALAARQGRLRRNFQGYTDDTAQTLIGVGASSISRLPQGYAQNAPATGAYTAAIREGRLSVTRGHAFSTEDLWRGRMIEALMCDFRIETAEMVRDFALSPDRLAALFGAVADRFGAMVRVEDRGLSIPDHARPLTRVIARAFDAYAIEAKGHSPAI